MIDAHACETIGCAVVIPATDPHRYCPTHRAPMTPRERCCPTCDRADCENFLRGVRVRVDHEDAPCPKCALQRECLGRAVDWRARALEAEAARDAAIQAALAEGVRSAEIERTGPWEWRESGQMFVRGARRISLDALKGDPSGALAEILRRDGAR